MADISFEAVAHLAEQLPPDQQQRLITHLRRKQAEARSSEVLRAVQSMLESSPMREELVDDLEHLRQQGAFHNTESLYGKFANPNAPEMSEDEFHAQLRALTTEWEQELDDLRDA